MTRSREQVPTKRPKARAREKPLRLRPSARLQRYLGQELISDPNLAVLEFVKNGYDAGASVVRVSFHLAGKEPHLVISDDGVGMDFASFQENWMHPGFSAKSEDAPRAVRERSVPATPSGRRLANRTPVGEKGLGRLAAGRLGRVMDVYTRPSTKLQWLHVHFDWADFDDMSKHMDQVTIPHGYLDHLPGELEGTRSGTAVVIRNLEQDWAGKMRGRPALGRSTTRLGRLKEDLQLLLRPLDIANPEFQVELYSDEVAEHIELGVISPRTAIREAPYRYEFGFSLSGRGKLQVRRVLYRSKPIAREFRKKEIEELGADFFSDGHRLETNGGSPSSLSCGPFSGVFLYTPPPKRERAKQADVVGHGVVLYRDSILVEPYGLGDNDWIGVEARKAQRQGHALIQPATFWGEVQISRSKNPALRDMANRQGLLENAATEEFFAHLRNEFRYFEDIVGSELEARWTSREEKAAEVAREQLKAVTLRTKSFAHHLRQPLMGMAGELVRLERLSKDLDIPAGQRERLAEIHARLLGYHQRAERLVNRYASGAVPRFQETDVHDLLKAVRKDVEDFAHQHGASLEVTQGVLRKMLLPRELLEEAIVELLVNAIEANRPPGREAAVSLTARLHRRELVIDIEDNGTGLPGVKAGTPLGEVRPLPTKGRPAEGLVQVCNVLTYARGSATVVSTSPEGTHITVRVAARTGS